MENSDPLSHVKAPQIFIWITVLNVISSQGNSSESPVPSTSESSTPSGKRRLSQTSTCSRPHISYSPLVCQTQSSSQAHEDDDDPAIQQMLVCCGAAVWDNSTEDQDIRVRQQKSPHLEMDEPFLALQEEEHSPDTSMPMETLTFEAAVATSLGRANTISTSMRTRSRMGWQVPNGHFRKRLAQSVSIAGGEALSDTEDDKY